MDPIAWDMRYGLPNQKYRVFVARYLLGQEPTPLLIDPFALDVPSAKSDGIYVKRQDVEDEIALPGTKIFMGPEGSGKTTLFNKLSALLSRQRLAAHPQPRRQIGFQTWSVSPGEQQALVVQLPLTQVGASVPEQDLMEGKVSLLTPKILAHYIFESYWDGLLYNHHQRAKYLPELRQDQRWMTMLRWFFRRCRPLHPEIPEEPALMEWLAASPASEPFSPYSPEDTLRELVHFVASRFAMCQPYAWVQVLVDDTERLSGLAVTRMLQDMHRLYDLRLDHMHFTLFIDSTWQNQIETMDCVRRGCVGVYKLPQWRVDELRRLLCRRLLSIVGGEFVDVYDWAWQIPETCLTLAAKPQFVQAIVEGALRNREQTGSGAPVHALRLARSLVAACAGCWEEVYAPPLTMEHVNNLIDLYWQAEQEERGEWK
jgi:hypothetical protein